MFVVRAGLVPPLNTVTVCGMHMKKFEDILYY